MLLVVQGVIGWVPLKSSHVGREDKRGVTFLEKGGGGCSVAFHTAHGCVKYCGQKEILLKSCKFRHSQVFRCLISPRGFNHRLLTVSLNANSDRLNFSTNSRDFNIWRNVQCLWILLKNWESFYASWRDVKLVASVARVCSDWGKGPWFWADREV